MYIFIFYSRYYYLSNSHKFKAYRTKWRTKWRFRLWSICSCDMRRVALGTNPTTLRWRQERMREHLKSCFESKIFTSVKPKKLEMFTIPLICICRLPEYAFKYVIQCMNCQQCYHKSCVGYEDRKGKIVNFSCFKCRKNTI